ncbi:DUF2931 family protein [Pseudomonas shirazensis]
MFQNKINYLFALLVICMFDSCQPKDTFKWNAGLSGPKYYGNGGPFVEYFYQGESIGGASTGGANQGWGITNSSASAGERFKPVPDSIFVKWLCSADRYKYEGGVKLPRKKMLDLFEKGTVDPFGDLVQYGLITAGMAPGGNVTVWLQGGLASTEICKFKIKKNDEYKENAETEKTEKKNFASYEFLNSEVNIFRYLHGIPYKIWETGEKECQYDIGYSTEDKNKKDYSMAIAGYTKDGSYVYSNEDPIPYINWNEKVNLDVKKYKKMPVHFYMQWISRDDQEWFEAEIVLPNDLETQFLDFQKKYGKDIFIIVGMEKVLENEQYTFGRIWFENSKGKKEIMKFRAAKLNVSKTRKIKYEVSKYSLPKGFVFPKWEGREPLTKPTDFDYWQEK